MSIHASTRRETAHGLEPIPWGSLAGVRIGIVLWGGLAVVDLGTLIHVPEYAELGAIAVIVTAACIGMGTPTGAAAALVGWLVVNGFVVHRFGVLGFDGAPDVARLALLAGLAMTATRARR